MKTILIQTLVMLAMIIGSCSCTQSKEQIITKKHNFVVVLDLSDRLLSNGQAEKDCAIINAAFNEFEKLARNPLIVTSKDKFLIRIIPQKGSKLRQDIYENKLNLDLSLVEAARKNSVFVAFKNDLQKNLTELYNEARLGEKHGNYAGVDIWKFFNNEINSVLSGDAENKITILTDGYFDFNDNTHVIRSGNRYTSTSFLQKINSRDWQAKSEKEDIGLLPVSIKTKAKWVLAGICSKQQNDILMESKLVYFWKKWLRESGADEPKIILDGASSVMANAYKQ